MSELTVKELQRILVSLYPLDSPYARTHVSNIEREIRERRASLVDDTKHEDDEQ